jgi:hypothetical protein
MQSWAVSWQSSSHSTGLACVSQVSTHRTLAWWQASTQESRSVLCAQATVPATAIAHKVAIAAIDFDLLMF